MTDHQPSPSAPVRRDLVDGRIRAGSQGGEVLACVRTTWRSGGVPAMDLINEEIARGVDAQAPGLGLADLVFVSGSALTDAWLPAARVLETQLARTVVLTGGPNRRMPEHVESEEHARLLLARGITSDQMIIERRSCPSVENVAFARPPIEERLGPVRTVIAVVKWWQRRQLHVLAAGMPWPKNATSSIAPRNHPPDVCSAALRQRSHPPRSARRDRTPLRASMWLRWRLRW